MATITKKELVDRIADKAGLKRGEVRDVVQSFLDEMVEELSRGNRLEFRDFGIFEPKTRAARKAQNPKTLQQLTVPSKRTVKFKMGRLLREGLTSEPKPQRERPQPAPGTAKAPARPDKIIESKPDLKPAAGLQPQRAAKSLAKPATKTLAKPLTPAASSNGTLSSNGTPKATAADHVIQPLPGSVSRYAADEYSPGAKAAAKIVDRSVTAAPTTPALPAADHAASKA